jgi:hypothetical protein
MVPASWEFHDALDAELYGASPGGSHRLDLAFVLCILALEHGDSVLALIRSNPSSALALVRLQYEVLVRALWVKYAATDHAVEKAVRGVPEGTTKEPDIFPTITDALASLVGKAPLNAIGPLTELKNGAWGAMNSYAHGSLRPIIRARNGYQPELLSQTLEISNTMQQIASMLLAECTGDNELLMRVALLAKAHLGVLAYAGKHPG